MKFRNNIFLSKNSLITDRKEKRKSYTNNGDVYKRLFNYSLIQEKMLNNLSNKYSIGEEEKYPFIPQINSRESNFYTNMQQLYPISNNSNNITDRNFFRMKSLNRLTNLKNNVNNYMNTFIRNKYENKSGVTSNNNSRIKKNFCNSFSNGYTYFDLNDSNYSKNVYKNKTYNKIKKIFPTSNKNKKIINNRFINLDDEDKDNENGERYDIIRNSYYNSNIKSSTNGSFLSKNYPFKKISNGKNIHNDYHINNKNNNKNKTIYPLPIPLNIGKISRNNNDLYNYLKNKIKYEKERNPEAIIISKKNRNKLDHEKRIMHSNNSSVSIYSLNSKGTSFLKSNLKQKSKYSPDKRERLFSFGSDLFFIDNNNSSLKIKKSNNKKTNLIKRNSKSLRTGSNSMRSQKNQISTKSSGTNTCSCYNNFKLNGNKNGSEKKILEIQNINEYSIINNENYNDISALNLQTTLQTLTDSKILDLANNYISDDDSLEGYKRKAGIYNKKYI